VKLIIILFLFSGCAPTMYRWSSESGRVCFNKCVAEYYRCNSQCQGVYETWSKISCTSNCGRAQDYCLAACPDLARVQ